MIKRLATAVVATIVYYVYTTRWHFVLAGTTVFGAKTFMVLMSGGVAFGGDDLAARTFSANLNEQIWLVLICVIVLGVYALQRVVLFYLRRAA